MSDITQTYQDIGGIENVYVPLYVDTTGQYGRIPSSAILDISGIYSSNFTVGGKPIMLADGSSSDGSTQLDFQSVYFQTKIVNGAARLSLEVGKDFVIDDGNNNPYFEVNSTTGKITIHGEMSVVSSIVKFEGAYQEFNNLNIISANGSHSALLIEPKPDVQFLTNPVQIKTTAEGPIDFSINPQGQTYIRDLILDSVDGITLEDLYSHISLDLDSQYKHSGANIFFDPQFENTNYVSFEGPCSISAAVNYVIDSISNEIDSLASQISSINTANIAGINFEQFAPASVWTIHHNTGSKFIQFTAYDESDRLIWPDDAFSLDDNTFVIIFGLAQAGRAILSCLLPPITTLNNQPPQS